MEYDWEECASFPNVRAKIKRYESVRISFLNEDLDEKFKELRGFTSRVFQHEIDHLNGLSILNWKVSFGDIEVIDKELMEKENIQIEQELKFGEEKESFNEALSRIKQRKDLNTKPRTIKELNTNDHEIDNTTYFNSEVASKSKETGPTEAEVDKNLKKIFLNEIGKIKRKLKK